MTANLTCTVEKPGLVDYDGALAMQRQAVEDCRSDGQARLFLLEHPHTYTLGARGDTGHLLADEERLLLLGASLRRTDRGGDITYHGPGQLVGYPIVNLKRWHEGPRWYVRSLEQVLIETLADSGIEGRSVDGRPGVWAGDSKIAAIGVRVSRGITSHGFALNVDPDLEYFSHIVPCGLPDITVTSMARELGKAPQMPDVMDTVSAVFGRVFDLKMVSPDREEAMVG
ncbi:MAG: lipoyl(octanoyl) transferase LipB [Chloroflexi bacterium]|nr:lipoyl(octanoyl) transferase LipB [Chloroflexota bacterium]